MEECGSRTLTFPDMEADAWTLLLPCVEDPLEARHMTVQDAIGLLPLYDKYQFPKGKLLCCEVLDQFLSRRRRWTRWELNTLVEVVLVADAANLESTMELVWELFLTSDECTDLFGRFNSDDVKQLVPVLVKHEAMVCALDTTTEELQNPLFPKLWEQTTKVDEMFLFTTEEFPSLVLSNTGYHFDGQYEANPAFTDIRCGGFVCRRAVRFSSLGPDPFTCEIVRRPTGEWCMVGYSTVLIDSNEQDSGLLLWWNVGRKGCHQALPPRSGWIATHPLTTGITPTIQYMHCDHSERQHIDLEAPYTLA